MKPDTNTELFAPDSVAMDSPRLAWIKRHGVVTHCSMPGTPDACWFAGFRDWWGDCSDGQFFIWETGHNGDSRMGEGETEDDAIAHLCRRHEIRLWNEEGA